MRSKQRLCLDSLELRLVPSIFYLHQGDSLQLAIDAARTGDTILLDAGAAFMGPITLMAKVNPNRQWIAIETNNFPLSAGTRVSPNDASSMAEILAPGVPTVFPIESGLSPDAAPPTVDNPQSLRGGTAMNIEPGANYYILRGLNILPVNAEASVYTLVALGDGSSKQSSVSQEPYNIEIDQCFIHGWDGQAIKRGIELNDGGTDGQNGVSNSYITPAR